MRSEIDPARWDGGGGRSRFVVALACAAVLEAAAAGGLLIASGRQQPLVAGDKAPMRIAIQVPPAPPVPPPPVPPPPTPPAPPVPVTPPVPEIPPMPLPDLPLPPPLPEPIAPSHRLRHATPRPPPPLVRPTAPAPQVAPPRPLPSPQPAQAAPSASETSQFEAALRRAVQASLIFPAGAQAAHEQGVARVRFAYRDGKVSDAVLVASSGFPMLDAAALQTVARARYPTPPGVFAGRSLTVDVDVVFRAAEEQMESD